ncbi:MAG: hypothetical protein ACI9R3_005556 [Verrucomicrobiales bacterium]
MIVSPWFVVAKRISPPHEHGKSAIYSIKKAPNGDPGISRGWLQDHFQQIDDLTLLVVKFGHLVKSDTVGRHSIPADLVQAFHRILHCPTPVFAFEIATSDVIEDEPSVIEMFVNKLLLNGFLALKQAVQRAAALIFNIRTAVDITKFSETGIGPLMEKR